MPLIVRIIFRDYSNAKGSEQELLASTLSTKCISKLMANELVRDKIKSNIDTAIREALNASEVDHPGMKGTIREIAIKNLFEPLLTGQTEIG